MKILHPVNIQGPILFFYICEEKDFAQEQMAQEMAGNVQHTYSRVILRKHRTNHLFPPTQNNV